ncbi:hypothetical protein BpHYR1_003838 [Brachionus plicatilis]|uniref:Uncharacterized protein n=1 Tax=Brachionus plicatilis TaxID=10195 RepID=A0A3M7RTS9_BRAPC|nr:hypothetical protein BpHYR1_003838 [Brachionus plicatilis]
MIPAMLSCIALILYKGVKATWIFDESPRLNRHGYFEQPGITIESMFDKVLILFIQGIIFRLSGLASVSFDWLHGAILLPG